jgi:MerR HTH family regulatory protein
LISLEKALPQIPAKRYFTIGEVAELCRVKPYVLRYWEQEFTQLKPMKRRGNRRYYQHHEVLLIRRIRDLLYEQGFTISGAHATSWVRARWPNVAMAMTTLLPATSATASIMMRTSAPRPCLCPRSRSCRRARFEPS